MRDNTEFDFKFKKIENHNFYNYNQYEPACGILSLLDITLNVVVPKFMYPKIDQ